MQIIAATSDADFLDQLIPALKDAGASTRTASLMQSFSQYAEEREGDIERIGLTKHEEFLGSINQLQQVREGTVALTAEILDLNQSIQASTEKLAEQKKALVNTRGIRQNITDVSDALKESLKILHAVNNAHELIRKRKYYAALKSLDDLQNEYLVPTIQNKYATQYKLADLIQKSIPASQKLISEAVMTDLNTWLFRVRETSQFLGELAFYDTDQRRERQKKRVESNEYLANFKLNSAIELVFDENSEFDVLDNDDVKVDFAPLFEALHIHIALNQTDKFRAEYAATRRQQKDLLLPSSVNLQSDQDEYSLSSLLEGVTGFAIMEQATMRRAPELRSSVDVRGSLLFSRPTYLDADTIQRSRSYGTPCARRLSVLFQRPLTMSKMPRLFSRSKEFSLCSYRPWRSMTRSACIYLGVRADDLQGWGYTVTLLNNFQLTLFHKYAELLKRRFSDDFQEVRFYCPEAS